MVQISRVQESAVIYQETRRVPTPLHMTTATLSSRFASEGNYYSNDAAFDWITLKIWDSISCHILSKIDVINYVTFRWMMCGFPWFATLHYYEWKLQKCIRMGITIFKNIILGDILSNIRSEITFYDRISDEIPPQMKML